MHIALVVLPASDAKEVEVSEEVQKFLRYTRARGGFQWAKEEEREKTALRSFRRQFRLSKWVSLRGTRRTVTWY